MRKTCSHHFSTGLLAAATIFQLGLSAGAPSPHNKAALAKAKHAAAASSTVVPRTATVHGETYEDLSARWWKWALTLPVELSNPYVTWDCNSQGKTQSGKVWFLFGVPGPTTLYCAIPGGQALFFPIVNSECSNVEDPPYFGSTPAARAACAAAWNDDVRDMTVTIDGTPVPDLTAYRVATSDFQAKLPDGNIFGLPKNTHILSSADGFYLFLNPLPPGPHEVRIAATAYVNGEPAFAVDTTWKLWVGE